MDRIKITPSDMYIGPDSICPFCSAHIKNHVGDNYIEIMVSPKECYQHIPPIGATSYTNSREEENNKLKIQYIYCPYCNKTSSKVYDCDRKTWVYIHPKVTSKQFPNVPEDLYRDYLEACAILNASPTASATLSRRCLQKMIRERWGIELSTFVKEINCIPSSNITELEREALHSAREIGNIGAHPDKILEVEPEDAELTIRIIELFLQKWYVDEPANQELLNLAIKTSQVKKATKKTAQTP